MKKLLKIFITLNIIFFWSIWLIYADENGTTSTWWDGTSKVVVTEKIPWMDCKWVDNQPIESRKYTCTVEWWFGSVMKMLAGFIKYITFLAALGWVLMLVVSWMRLSIEWKKDEAKKMVKNVIIALLVIFLMWFILNTVAPWVYK